MKTTKFLIPLIFSTVLPVLTVSPARAEWEYTRWGMTPQEVQKASRGSVVTVSPKEQSTPKGNQRTLLKSNWSVGPYPFEVFFNFSGGKPQLTEVLLVSTGYNQDLGQKLIEKYGPPTTAQGGLRQNPKDRKFTLTQRDNYAIPETARGAAPTPSGKFDVLMEWVTPTDFIQLKRQGPENVILKFQPTQQGRK